MLEITNPITSERLQIAQYDLKNKMDLSSAKKSCLELGIGWRLPNINELELIHKELHLNGLGDFENDSYWSISKAGDWDDPYDCYFLFSFNSGKIDFNSSVKAFYVRAVRTI